MSIPSLFPISQQPTSQKQPPPKKSSSFQASFQAYPKPLKIPVLGVLPPEPIAVLFGFCYYNRFDSIWAGIWPAETFEFVHRSDSQLRYKQAYSKRFNSLSSYIKKTLALWKYMFPFFSLPRDSGSILPKSGVHSLYGI